MLTGRTQIRRLNLVLNDDLYTVIEKEAKANYLRTGTYVKQLLNKHFTVSDNSMSNLKSNEL